MPNDRWKSVEREAARLFGTERIPRDGSSGADFKTSLIAAEVKTRSEKGPLISVFAAQALLQAEEAVRTEPELKGLIPFALLHSKGSKIGNSFCIIRAENLAKLEFLAYQLCQDRPDIAEIAKKPWRTHPKEETK